MTITEIDTGLAARIGDAAAELLPADEGWSVLPDAEGPTLPDGDVRAAGARIGDHVLAIVVSADMERRIQVGPPPAEGLLDGLAPAIKAVAETLGLDVTAELVPMEPRAVLAESSSGAASCALLDGEQHLVTVVVSAPTAADEPDTASFEPIVSSGAPAAASGLDVLHDVQMGVTVELGRTRMQLRDILTVAPGSVIELDRAASAPVDVLVNGTLIARGEVVVIDEEFGIRITEIVGQDQTITGAPQS